MRNSLGARSGGAASLVGDAGRFLGAGIANTALTLVAYQLLLFVFSAPVAYAVTWVIGIGFVALVYPSEVFRGGRTGKTARALMAGIYVLSFGIGIAMIELFTAMFGERVAIVAALTATTCFNFVAMRTVMRGEHSKA